MKNKFFHWLFETPDSTALTFQRVVTGIIFFPHGAQKVLGWFGGFGFEGTMGYFTHNMGIPAIFVFLDIVAEFFGALGLITGTLTKISAFGLTVVMLVAVFMIHIHNGFFMNWTGQAAGEGFEYHLLALALLLVLMIKGGGNFSVDKIIATKNKKESAVA